MVTVLVDLQDVLSIAEIVVRIERGYDRLKGPVRRQVENFLRTWNIGLALGGGGFTATLQRNPHVDAESVLLRLLELPANLFDRNGTTSLIVFRRDPGRARRPGSRRQDPQRHPASG